MKLTTLVTAGMIGLSSLVLAISSQDIMDFGMRVFENKLNFSD